MISGPHGILLVDKGPGWTSHDVVAKVRRLCGQRKIGHTGTLDPMATGLLVLCIGDATRLVEYMSGHDKRYVGEILLGQRTDTDDADGTLLETRPVPVLTVERLREIESAFSGRLLQRPPAYSAVKVDGQRAYAAARRGEAMNLSPRPVVVHELHLVSLGDDRLRIEATCGAGTYIRSLARDIGEALGSGAHLAALRRTQVGRFSIDDSITLDELASLVPAGPLNDLLRSADEGVIESDVAILAAPHSSHFTHGADLDLALERPLAAGPIRVYNDAGSFLGMAGAGPGGGIRPLKVLSSAQIS